MSSNFDESDFAGPQQPDSDESWLYAIPFFLTMGLAGYSFFGNFVPSKNWGNVGLYLGIALGFIVSVARIYGVETGRFEKGENNKKAWKRFFGHVFVSSLITVLVYFALVFGAGKVVTQVLGDRSEKATYIEKDAVYGRRSLCLHRLKLMEMYDGFNSFLCVDEKSFRQLPSNSLIKVSGVSTYFGMSIESWRVIRESGKPE